MTEDRAAGLVHVRGYNIYMTKTVVVGDGDAVTVTRV